MQHQPTSLQEEFITESLRQPPAESLDVFVSYSRTDSDFARKLNDTLQMQGKTTWFDQESIASGTDFQQEIYRGIKACDNFLFILSPRAVLSPFCADEVEYAASLNKRFVTVLHRDVNSNHMHPELAKVQWIDFNQNERDFNANFNQLVRTLDNDREHVHSHTKWLQQAIAWDSKGKIADLLLRGSELAVAEAWLKETEQQKKQPAATPLQKEYIAQSGRYRRKNRRLLIGAGVSVMGVMTAAAVGSIILWQRAESLRQQAEKQTQIATLRENAARVQNLVSVIPVEALVLAIKATGESQSSLPEVLENTLPQIQSGLYDALGVPLERNNLKGHQHWVNSVAFSPDGKTIVSGSRDKTIRLWDTTGKPIGQPLKGHQAGVYSVAFSPDGKTIVSGSRDKTIRLWDTTGKPIGQPMKGHQAEVNSVAFSPDGKTIVSSSWDKTIRLWDTTGKPIGQPLKGHQDGVNSVAFSPDGKTIISGSSDKTIRLWNTTGKPIGQPLIGHEHHVNKVVFSPDGKTIISGSGDNTIRLWRGGTWQDWLGMACNRLIDHPILVDPKTTLAEDSEMIEVAKGAGETCQKLAWNPAQKAHFLANQGWAIGQGGDVLGAMAKFQDARKLSPSIDIPSEAEVGWWAAGGLVEKGEKLVQEGKVKEALDDYEKAQRLKPTWKLPSESWDTLCWYGSLHGQAAEVMQACENAVTLAPKNGWFRDSRGVARALTGNKQGAIADFQAFIKSADSNEEEKKQRLGWIDALKAGKNPFTPEQIEKLKG